MALLNIPVTNWINIFQLGCQESICALSGPNPDSIEASVQNSILQAIMSPRLPAKHRVEIQLKPTGCLLYHACASRTKHVPSLARDASRPGRKECVLWSFIATMHTSATEDMTRTLSPWVNIYIEGTSRQYCQWLSLVLKPTYPILL